MIRSASHHFSSRPGEFLSGFLAFSRDRLLLAGSLALLLASATPSFAEARTWRSAGGDQSFVGDYLTHDQRRVTVRRNDGRSVTFDISRLHADDQAWLATLNPDSTTADQDPVVADDSAVFDNLHLGDTHPDVREKLDASEIVELAVARTFLGRFGLNGTYRTRQQVGGQHCLLFFDWTDGDTRRMRELSLQTEPRGTEQYSSKLQTTWKEFSSLLTKLHGPPLQTAGFPKLSDLDTDGMFLASHLWRLENGHSALLGSARDLGKYSVVVRFTTETIKPIKIPPAN